MIRTIILSGNKFEFQTGGGIVYDSSPLGEKEETVAKALGICRAMGIEVQELEI